MLALAIVWISQEVIAIAGITEEPIEAIANTVGIVKEVAITKAAVVKSNSRTIIITTATKDCMLIAVIMLKYSCFVSLWCLKLNKLSVFFYLCFWFFLCISLWVNALTAD